MKKTLLLILAAAICLSGTGVATAATTATGKAKVRIEANDPSVVKKTTTGSLNLETRDPSRLSIEYMELPKATPFYTDADFVMPFQSKITPDIAPLAGVSAPSYASAVNLPKTLPTFNYMPLYDQAWVTAYDFSLCSFNPNDGTTTKLAGNDAFYAADFAIAAGSTLYTSVPLSNGSTYRGVVNLDTYQVEKLSVNDNKLQALSAAYDKTTGTIYVCSLKADNSAFYLTTFNPEDGTLGAEIKSYGAEGMSAMGVNRAGQLYGISRTGSLYKIDKTTGDLEKIASYSNLTAQYNCSGCCDMTRDIFYYAYFGGVGTSQLIAFDLNTGAGQIICDIPRSIEMQGLWIAVAPFDDGMPGEPTDYKVTFTDDSLDGTVSFILPATTYGGDVPAAGSKVNYELLFNDVVRYSGSGDYGQAITLPVSVDKRGAYTIQLKVSNEAGYGEALSDSRYVGYDDVTGITRVTMDMSDTAFTVKWNALTAVHGGYINPAHISYDVVRYPDGTTVAAGTDQTSLVVPIAADLPDGNYSFGITAHFYNPETGAIEAKPEVKSGVRIRGDYKVPFSYSLTNANEASQIFKVENTNKDSQTWVFTSQGAMIQYNDDNATMAMDDWLFSMPIHLEANIIYNFTSNVFVGNDGYTERLEVKAGTDTDSKSMSINVVPKTTFNSEKLLAGSFVVETPGTYYIGIHGCSDPDMYYLVVEDIAMDVAGTIEAPGAATDLALQAVYGTDLEQTQISFKAPTVNAAGNPLSAIDRIEILRNGDVAHVFDNPAPGAALSYLDTIVKRGTQEYKIIAYNEHGAGMAAVDNVFVGYGRPLSVEQINYKLEDDDNTVTLWWNAVTHDVNGRRIDRTMWYQPNVIFPNSAQSTAGNGIYASAGFTHSNIQDKYAQLNPNYDVETNDQFFVRYYLSNYYYEGKGLWEGPTHTGASIPFTTYIPVGKAYSLPIRESFADGNTHYAFVLDGHGTHGSFDLTDSSQLPSAQSYDGDGGMIMFVPQYIDDKATLYLGRVNLRDAVIPRVSFYYYAVPGSEDLVRVNAGTSNTNMATVASIKVGGTPSAGWTKAEVDLSAYSGKVVQIGIGATCVSGTSYVLIDNIEITDPEENNLAIGNLEVASTVRANREMTVAATVTNNGHYDMAGYKATLYVNDQAVETKEGQPVAQGKTQTIAFNYTPKVTNTDGLWCRIEIAADDDSNIADNTTDDLYIQVVMPSYPTVTDLSAKAEGTGVTLEWSRPTGIGDVAELTEDNVEGYAPFSTGLESSELGENDYIGNWSVVDADGQPVTQIANRDFANNRADGEGNAAPKAWMVFNIEQANVAAAYQAGLTPHSGKQCFICPAAIPVDDTRGNDDWLISPLLSGKAQTVSFFAKSISTVYGYERFEVLYSTASNAIEDFQSLYTTSVDDNWHVQTAELPEGARYFAIRCISYDVWALMVDDITFEAGADESLQLTGYNVYRNLKLMVTEPLTECNYSDVVDENSVNDYHVSAIYNLGESALSNVATIDLLTSGLDNVTVGGITISVDQSAIIVSGAYGDHITVVTADGRTAASVTANEVTRIPVQSGTYVVKVGRIVVKLIVR